METTSKLCIVKSIFGGNSIVIYRSPAFEYSVVDAILVNKKYVGFITTPKWSGENLVFWLFSIENKTFEKFQLQGEDPEVVTYSSHLLYSSLLDR